jgi:hypothetical protein
VPLALAHSAHSLFGLFLIDGYCTVLGVVLPMRHFPPPWTVEAIDAGFKVVDATGQSLAYVYGHVDSRDAGIANALTLDEARRIAANIAKLPSLLGKGD